MVHLPRLAQLNTYTLAAHVRAFYPSGFSLAGRDDKTHCKVVCGVFRESQGSGLCAAAFLGEEYTWN